MARPDDLRVELVIDRLIRTARDLEGRYTRLQGEALRANRRLAEQLSQLAGEQLQRGLVRRAASTGRLRKVIENPRNRYADRDLIAVGRESYLDKSSVRKYWRQIEGAADSDYWMVLVRRRAVMVGYWTGSGGRRGFESVRGRGGLGQRFVSTSPPRRGAMARARKVLGGDSRAPRGGAGRTRDGSQVIGQVTRPIVAERFMQEAGEAFHRQQRAERLYEQLFAKAGVPVRFTQTS